MAALRPAALPVEFLALQAVQPVGLTVHPGVPQAGRALRDGALLAVEKLMLRAAKPPRLPASAKPPERNLPTADLSARSAVPPEQPALSPASTAQWKGSLALSPPVQAPKGHSVPPKVAERLASEEQAR